MPKTNVISKVLSVLFLCTLLLQCMALPSLAASPAAFSDVHVTDWFYEDVMFAYEHGLINGYPNGRFCPNDAITYGQLIQILCRAKGVCTPNSSVSDCISYAYANGWYSATEDLQTKAFQFARRKVACHVLLASAGIDPYPHEIYGTCGYTDFSEIRNIYGVDYQDYACASYQLGLFIGDDCGSFNPDATITRAEFCTVLHRLFTEVDLMSYTATGPLSELTIILLDDASESSITGIIREIAHFPPQLIQLFNDKHWRIQVTDQDTVNGYIPSGYDITGFTDYQQKVICVAERSASYGSALIHEFGHFVMAYCKTDAASLTQAYIAEAERISNYAASDKAEYFAEAFTLYMSSAAGIREAFIHDCPLSYALLDSCVNQLIFK